MSVLTATALLLAIVAGAYLVWALLCAEDFQ